MASPPQRLAESGADTPKSLLRYRSIRQQQQQQQQQQPLEQYGQLSEQHDLQQDSPRSPHSLRSSSFSTQPTDASVASSIERSRSRYHDNHPDRKGTSEASRSVSGTQSPVSTDHSATGDQLPDGPGSPTRSDSAPKRSSSYTSSAKPPTKFRSTESFQRRGLTTGLTKQTSAPTADLSVRAAQEAQRILQAEKDKLRTIKEQKDRDQLERDNRTRLVLEEAARIADEQKRKAELEQLALEVAREKDQEKRRRRDNLDRAMKDERTKAHEKVFGFPLPKRDSHSKDDMVVEPRSPLRSPLRQSKSNEFLARIMRRKAQSKPADDMPLENAPIPPTNADTRWVRVQVEGKALILPARSATTADDLIRSASEHSPALVNPRISILVEVFSKVGVQRRLRKYERIVSVLNSWDDDRANCLHIVFSETNGPDVDLEAFAAPHDPPAEFKCEMHHSMVPGRWDACWVTLRPDGQILRSKEANTPFADQTKLCHLTDYDLYTPMARQLGRKIRPPKKGATVFAIKSQKRSALFDSPDGYVHFFSLVDTLQATQFAAAVHGWRSWYLVRVLDSAAGPEKKRPLTAIKVTAKSPSTAPAGQVQTPTRTSHSNAPSLDNSSYYQLGTFKPLLDFDNLMSARPPSSHLPPSPPLAAPVAASALIPTFATVPQEPQYGPEDYEYQYQPALRLDGPTPLWTDEETTTASANKFRFRPSSLLRGSRSQRRADTFPSPSTTSQSTVPAPEASGPPAKQPMRTRTLRSPKSDALREADKDKRTPLLGNAFAGEEKTFKEGSLVARIAAGNAKRS